MLGESSPLLLQQVPSRRQRRRRRQGNEAWVLLLVAATAWMGALLWKSIENSSSPSPSSAAEMQAFLLSNREAFDARFAAWHGSDSSETADASFVETTEADAAKLGRLISNWTVSEKHSLQNSWTAWWKSASHAERTWWNHTLQGLENAEGATEHWWNRTEHAIVAEDRKVNQGVVALWNRTEQSAREEWQESVEVESQWWNETASWLSHHIHQQQTANPPLLYLNASRAYGMLSSNNYYYGFDASRDFFALLRGFNVQRNQGYCGVATAAAVLNSFSVNGDDATYEPYSYVTQDSLPNNVCVQDTVVTVNDSYNGILSPPGGLNLHQVADLLRCQNVPNMNVSVYPVALTHENGTSRNRDAVDHARTLHRALLDPRSRVLVNYARGRLGQVGGGHFSPLGAIYRDTTSSGNDRVLILDVAKYKYPPVWVPLSTLLHAMATPDNCGLVDYPVPPLQGNGMPTTMAEYRAAQVAVGCRSAPRGYIVVTITNDE